jgi:hypothetical protein
MQTEIIDGMKKSLTWLTQCIFLACHSMPIPDTSLHTTSFTGGSVTLRKGPVTAYKCSFLDSLPKDLNSFTM